MAYNLNVIAKDITFNSKYQNLSKYKKPAIEAKAPNGKLVSEKTTYQGQVLGPGSTQRQWVDDVGAVYSKQELTFLYEGEPVEENSKLFRKIFEIQVTIETTYDELYNKIQEVVINPITIG